MEAGIIEPHNFGRTISQRFVVEWKQISSCGVTRNTSMEIYMEKVDPKLLGGSLCNSMRNPFCQGLILFSSKIYLTKKKNYFFNKPLQLARTLQRLG